MMGSCAVAELWVVLLGNGSLKLKWLSYIDESDDGTAMSISMGADAVVAGSVSDDGVVAASVAENVGRYHEVAPLTSWK